MKRIYLVALLLVVTSIVSAPAVAQENSTDTSTPTRAPSPTPIPSSPTETSTATPTQTVTPKQNVTYAADLPGDPAVRVRDWDYLNEHDVFIITFESDVPRLLTLTYVSDEGDGGTSVGTIEQKAIPAGVTNVRVTVPSGVVWVATDVSQQNGQFLQIEADTDGELIPEPYDASDVRDAGIGGALGALVALIYEAIVAKAGAKEWGERLA